MGGLDVIGTVGGSGRPARPTHNLEDDSRLGLANDHLYRIPIATADLLLSGTESAEYPIPHL